MASQRTPRGFSLLELIVTVALIGVLAAAVVPMFRDSLIALRSNRTLEDLTALMKYCQERAVSDVTEHRLYVDEDAGVFWVERHEGFDDGKPVFNAVEESYARRLALPEDVEIRDVKANRVKGEPGRHYIRFYPSGASDYAELEFRLADRSRYAIDLEGSFGRFEVVED